MVAKYMHRIVWLQVLIVSLISIQFGSAEDLIWYQGSSDYYTGHQYGWQGTTDGESAPAVVLESVVNQPWLIALSKAKNVVYWIDNKGIIGAWNATSRHSSVVYQFPINRWDEYDNGPALTGIDIDDLNNHLYFTFNRSIYRLDLSQSDPPLALIATYDNLVFNPRFSASRNSLFFCIRNKYQEQGDLVQVSLSDPTTLTTLVYNTSTGSIVQQLFLDDSTNTLYYNSPGTLTMRGVSLNAPYNQVFTSIYLSVNPTFFDFNPSLNTFVLGDLRFNNAYLWSLGPAQPTKIYSPSSGRVTGVKFFNDTHVLVAYQIPASSLPGEGKLSLVNINNPNEISVLVQNFGMGVSLIFDEKYCNFYYTANPKNRTTAYLDQLIIRKNIKEETISIYQSQHMTSSGTISGISLDVDKRNLIVARTNTDDVSAISYFPIDKPDTTPVPIIDSRGRSITGYAVNEKTGDIFYSAYEGYEYNIYCLNAASISKDWINNVGHLVVPGIYRLYSARIAIDSVNSKMYYTDGSATIQIVQANLDGSAAKTIFNISNSYNVQSMKWDPTSERLFILATPNRTWHMMSINSDGSSPIYTSLKYSSGSARDLFSSISPDPFSDWVYMNAEYYQPLRIKKDGSVIENLYSYVPFSSLGSISFDETTGDIYFNDVQCTLKKINIRNINKEDPVATPVEISWQGDAENFYLSQFFHDKSNQIFWLLQSNQSTAYPYSNYTVSVTPVKGGPTKQLFNFPKNVHGPWAIDIAKGKMFAYSYFLRFAQQQEPTIVMMDLYNGSNLRTMKQFKYPQYSQVSLTAMTLDTRTGLLYYSLRSFDGKTSTVECFDPVTFITKKLFETTDLKSVQDMKFNGSVLVLAGTFGNALLYDTNSGILKNLNTTAGSIALDPKSDTIYLTGGSIFSANINNPNATQVMLLSTIKIKDTAFDFANKKAYYTLINSGVVSNVPPYYYQSDLDGKNKKKMQVQNAFYAPTQLNQLTLTNGKFYASNYGLDTFNLDGSGYSRIIQNTYVAGKIQFNSALQRAFWQEDYGSRLYSCAVYSNKYADCEGYNLFPSLQFYTKPQLNSFVVGNNGLVYFAAQYLGTIYSMDLKIGQPSLKVFIKDPLFYSVNAVAMNKANSALFVATSNSQSPSILRVSLDGTITTLYSNVTAPYNLLLTDLTHCQD